MHACAPIKATYTHLLGVSATAWDKGIALGEGVGVGARDAKTVTEVEVLLTASVVPVVSGTFTPKVVTSTGAVGVLAPWLLLVTGVARDAEGCCVHEGFCITMHACNMYAYHRWRAADRKTGILVFQ